MGYRYYVDEGVKEVPDKPLVDWLVPELPVLLEGVAVPPFLVNKFAIYSVKLSISKVG